MTFISRFRFRHMSVLVLALSGQQPASAQCSPHWVPGDGFPGLNNAAHALIEWDPDAGGPQAPLLVAGGQFTIAGNQLANRVAAWNGNAWQALGSGVDGTVRALAVFNGELIAAGDFSFAGGVAANHIARWNGTAWQALGAGVNGQVHALHVHNNQLIVGGSFTQAGGLLLSYLARWTGSGWFGAGVAFNGPVRALTRHNVSGNNVLVAAGDFTSPTNRIGWWNGAFTWQGFGSGMNGVILALSVHNGQLVAGGDFTLAGGAATNKIARWTGSAWQTLGGGISGTPWVNSLLQFNGELIAGGNFAAVDGVSARGIARWNGTTWQAFAPDLGPGSVVYALATSGGLLYAAGSIGFAGAVPARSAAAWNGTDWSSLGVGTPSPVVADVFRIFRGELIAGGENSGLYTWDGRTWTGFGPSTLALAEYQGDLIAGGPDDELGYVSRWDGANWQWLGSGMGIGNGLCDSGAEPYAWVHALTVHDNGDLIAAGEFDTASGLCVRRIARWNGASWQAMGTGIIGGNGPPYPGVFALAMHNGELIAGGSFTSAGGASAINTARWLGSAWTSMGGPGGNAQPVYALTEYNGTLFAGGAGGIRQWNHQQGFWSTPGLGIIGTVEALAVYDNELVAGGAFTSAGGQPASNIARWNGTEWLPLGTGTNGRVRALVAFNGELIASGDFTMAGGAFSYHWARWVGCTPCSADIAPQPNGDGVVNVNDLLLVIGNWGATGTNFADINHDNVVDVNDLLAVVGAWGACP